ncbi:MAG: A/G-specific adenine glycosylase [Clostridiales bacterium]|nr:A/G-specific adenine glycosylase [Clostridiales bacterium]
MQESNNTAQLFKIVDPLLHWYHENARRLPWRENTDPYRVWVSEIMLQQTRVAAVIPYFLRFMEQLPSIEALANAPWDQLMKLWEGLGYYSRARNLQKAARVICEKYGGVFPDRYKDILSLPGIGPYTAGAVASISFGQPVPAVDGNVLRVISRLLEWDADLTGEAEKKRVAALLVEIYPEGQCGDFTQALMELGAVVCTPGISPKCEACPIRSLCNAFAAGTQASFPVIPPKKPRKMEEKTVFLLRCGDRVAVRRRDVGGLLGGLWEFPGTEGHLDSDAAEDWLKEHGIDFTEISPGTKKKHIFTHIEWHMDCFLVLCKNTNPAFTWVTKQELEEKISLPTAFQKFLGELSL